MFNIQLGYPSYEAELQIVKNTTSDHRPTVSKILHGDDISIWCAAYPWPTMW